MRWEQRRLSLIHEMGEVAGLALKRCKEGLQEDGNVRISFTETNHPGGFSALVVKGTGLDADPRLTFLPKHQLEVKGKIELDGNRPEIKVTSRDQIVKPPGE